MAELTFNAVQDRWLAAGGKNTGGIITWFEHAVTRWEETKIPAVAVGDLHFIGADAGNDWATATNGTSRMRDFRSPRKPDPNFRWDPDWVLVALRDPENGERVLIDGNARALEVHLAVSAQTMPADQKIALITGELNVGVVRIAKAISPLWR
jgi:hypothetical protein